MPKFMRKKRNVARSAEPPRKVVYWGAEAKQIGRFGIVTPGRVLELTSIEYAYAMKGSPDQYFDLNADGSIPPRPAQVAPPTPVTPDRPNMPIAGPLHRDWQADTLEYFTAKDRNELTEIAEALAAFTPTYVYRGRMPKTELAESILQAAADLGWRNVQEVPAKPIE